MEGPPPDSDEQFAEWYVWAKREVSSDRRACLGVAQAGVEAVNSGADRIAAEEAARRSMAGTAVMLLRKVSPWRQGYAQWYEWARLEFGGDPARLHRLTRIAIERLKVDGDAGHAAEAARAAAAADQPAGGTATGWGPPTFSSSTAPIGTGGVPMPGPGASGLSDASPYQGSGRPPFASGPATPVIFEPVAYAGFGRRLGAAVTDAVLGLLVTALTVVVVGAFWFIAAVSTREASNEQVALTELALLVMLGVVFWVYDAGLESSPAQATLGKRAVGLLVLDGYARRISFGRATARHFVKFVPLALGVLPLILSLQGLLAGVIDSVTVTLGIVGLVFSVCAAIEFLLIALTRQKRGLHDLIAGTVVVRRDMLSRVVPASAAPPPAPQAVPEARPGIPAVEAPPRQI